jgi:predicted O-methyltransferase YrrM
MDARVRAVIDEVWAEGERHDANEPDRLKRWRVLEPQAGELIWFLVHVIKARTIVEVGTSRGVSTLWLAEAARTSGGRVRSVDLDMDSQAIALRHLTKAGLADQVDFTVGDGGALLTQLPDESVDLLFLDSERTEYPGWWPHPARVLRPGGLLIADNALSHPAEIAPLRALVEGDPRLTATTLTVGKGELVAVRS